MLQFDSSDDGELHGSVLLHRCLAKLWAVHAGHGKGSPAWRRSHYVDSWVSVKGPQQPSVWECGWYAMTFAMEYSEKADRPIDWRDDMSGMFDAEHVARCRTSLSTAILEVMRARNSAETEWNVLVYPLTDNV